MPGNLPSAMLAVAVSGEPVPPPMILVIDSGAPSTVVDPVTACVAERIRPFVGPYGVQQAWPTIAPPPEALQHTLGTPLSDTGMVADGYRHTLHADTEARTVYVVEQGGFAGTVKVYGPLPLPQCRLRSGDG